MTENSENKVDLVESIVNQNVDDEDFKVVQKDDYMTLHFDNKDWWMNFVTDPHSFHYSWMISRKMETWKGTQYPVTYNTAFSDMRDFVANPPEIREDDIAEIPSQIEISISLCVLMWSFSHRKLTKEN